MRYQQVRPAYLPMHAERGARFGASVLEAANCWAGGRPANSMLTRWRLDFGTAQ